MESSHFFTVAGPAGEFFTHPPRKEVL